MTDTPNIIRFMDTMRRIQSCVPIGGEAIAMIDHEKLHIHWMWITPAGQRNGLHRNLLINAMAHAANPDGMFLSILKEDEARMAIDGTPITTDPVLDPL